MMAPILSGCGIFSRLIVSIFVMVIMVIGTCISIFVIVGGAIAGALAIAINKA